MWPLFKCKSAAWHRAVESVVKRQGELLASLLAETERLEAELETCRQILREFEDRWKEDLGRKIE